MAIRDGAFSPDRPRGSQFKEKSRTLQLKNPPSEVQDDVFRSCRRRELEWPLAGEAGIPPHGDDHLSDTEDSASKKLSDDDVPADASLPAARSAAPSLHAFHTGACRTCTL